MYDNMLTHVSLFSGIGGFDYVAGAVGFKNCACVEIDRYCRDILKLRFPESHIYDDIFTLTGEELLNDCNGTINLMSGGFPCQPLSIAGDMKGSEDRRWLWDEYSRIIDESKPNWVIIENSQRIYKIPEWELVRDDLQRFGYSCGCFIVPANAVGAPHLRKRAIIVAAKERSYNSVGDGEGKRRKPTNPYCIGLEKGKSGRIRFNETLANITSMCCYDRLEWLPDWKKNPSEVCRVDNGVPRGLDKSRIKALGNSIVPRVFYPFFEGIYTIEEYLNNNNIYCKEE